MRIAGPRIIRSGSWTNVTRPILNLGASRSHAKDFVNKLLISRLCTIEVMVKYNNLFANCVVYFGAGSKMMAEIKYLRNMLKK